MKEYQQGDWYVIEHKTMKPFEHFKAAASMGLMDGLGGLFTTHSWNGRTVQINSLSCEGTTDYNNGIITCRIRFKRESVINSTPLLGKWMREKVLSDVRSFTLQICGLFDTDTRDVFIVHGHDHQSVSELKDFVRQLGLNPVVLHEQDDKGLTIIEKFEHFGSACSFAFILMTPDDQGSHKDSAEDKWRARQNVILELGWFMARLGRERVAILYKDQLEIPSDLLGVLYLKFDNNIFECADKLLQRLRGLDLIQGAEPPK